MRTPSLWLPLCRFAALLFIAAVGVVSTIDAAASAPLLPNTKIRLTIVQWMPTKGVYENWATVSGEYTVSNEGVISVPLLGIIVVGNKDETALASDIAQKLKEKVGLIAEPAATIEILGFPSIYVVGDVAKPGEYQFHPGLNILQALAMSGGEMRPQGTLQTSLDVTRIVGDLKEIDDSIIRVEARIERLEAEMAGTTTLQLDQKDNNSDPFKTAIYKQEEAIFTARANEVGRQAKSISELRDLLSEEIAVLQQKTTNSDANIKSVQRQLTSVIALVERGAVVPTRQAEVERTLRDFQTDKLDLAVSIMRARQGITQATRDLEGLYDRRHTEVATELQSERAALAQLKFKRETNQQLLYRNLSSVGPSKLDEKPMLKFIIVRRTQGKDSELDASETTAMVPGDVLKVTLRAPSPSQAKPLDAIETTKRTFSQ
jgi:polysaccharide export outer membrane protein